MTGKAYEKGDAWMEELSMVELKELLYRQAHDLQKAGDLSIDPIRWDGVSSLERRAINHLGFLFLSYRPRAWWFELLEMGRKLVMVSGSAPAHPAPSPPELTALMLLLPALSSCGTAAPRKWRWASSSPLPSR